MESQVRYRQNLSIAGRKIHDQAVLFDTRAGVMRRLNPVATEIWETLEQPRTVEDIVKHVCGEFEVSPADATPQIQEFLQLCLDRRLVEVWEG